MIYIFFSLTWMVFILYTTQLDYYGHRNRQDTIGKKRKNHRILQESNGNRRNWKQYFYRKIFGFFPGRFRQIPSISWQKLVGNHRKQDQKNSGENTTSTFHRFPVESCRTASTWADELHTAASVFGKIVKVKLAQDAANDLSVKFII